MEPDRVLHSPQAPSGTAAEDGVSSPAGFQDLHVFHGEEITLPLPSVDADFAFGSNKERMSSPGVVRDSPLSAEVALEERSNALSPRAAPGPVDDGTAKWRMESTSSSMEPVSSVAPVALKMPEGDEQLLPSVAPSANAGDATSLYDSGDPIGARELPSAGFLGRDLPSVEPGSSLLPHVTKVPDAEEQLSSNIDRSADAAEAPSPVEIPQKFAAGDVEASRPPGIDQCAVDAVAASHPFKTSQQLAVNVNVNVPSSSPMDDGSSPAEPIIAPVSSVVSKSTEAKEQRLNSAEPGPDAMDLCPPENPRSPRPTTGLATANGAESGFERGEEENEEQHPAKRPKNGIVYTGSDAVSAILGQTAEIVLVLAGMSQMRAGRTPTPYERELATTAYQNLGILVSRVAPNSLVARESLERMLSDYDMKRLAHKRRQDQAWQDALAEAEALANARVEAILRAKAEAAARAQAEADELERARQAAITAAALAANGPGRCGFSPGAVPPLSSGLSESFPSGVAQSPSLSTPTTHPSPQAEIVSQSPAPNTPDVPRLSPPEKCVSINGLSQSPASRPGLTKPPKIRNRARKDPSAVAFMAPDLLTQDQSPDSQKSQFTHKQLCVGVQRFIRDHVPLAPQTLQALPPNYINKPSPCQICKLIANDTESVLVCDSCDEVSHVKCVQPHPSKCSSERDWYCSKCTVANRGYPSKYGPIRRGAPNSVPLWPPHETSASHRDPKSGVLNGPLRGRGELLKDARRVHSGLKVQRKTSLEINTDFRPSQEDHNTGSLGNSPHLIVHLVNEPSPRPSTSLNKSSHILKGENRRPVPSAQSTLSSVQVLSSSKMVAAAGAAENHTAPVGEPGKSISKPSDSVHMPLTETSEKRLSESDGRYGSLAEFAEQETSKSQVQNEKPEARVKIIGSKKGAMDSAANLSEKQGTVPTPIVMEWVGGSIRQAEGKVYYRACRVGGITFSVSDCALFRPEPPDVAPYIARLQVLWEDVATSHKWVRVSWCYYPSDIPLSMDRPGSTTPNEVYESNHCDDNLVGSIQGPCFVLPPTKFREEVERRSALKKGREAVEELPPLFLSRWMYDASKVVFRPLQE